MTHATPHRILRVADARRPPAKFHHWRARKDSVPCHPQCNRPLWNFPDKSSLANGAPAMASRHFQKSARNRKMGRKMGPNKILTTSAEILF